MSRLAKITNGCVLPLERVSKLYRRIASVDVVKNGRWVSKTQAVVTTERQDLDSNSKIRMAFNLRIDDESIRVEPGPLVDTKNPQYFSPSGKFNFICVKTGDTFRFDVNSVNGLEASIQGVVSQPISDPNLQYISWQADESGFVFVGEKAKPKSSKPWEIKSNASQDDLKVAIQSSVWETKDSWGECFADNSCFTLYYVDIIEGTVVDMIADGFSVNTSSVSPVIIEAKKGRLVLFTGVDHAPRRLGIVYCRNRPSRTFAVSAKSIEKQTPLEVTSVSQFRGIFNVRAFGDRVAFFSQAREGSLVVKENYPHNCACSLHVASIEELVSSDTDASLFYDATAIVSIVNSTPANPLNGFHGLFPPTGNDLWWVQNGSAIIVGSVARSSTKVYRVDVKTRVISPLQCCEAETGQWSILDVRDDVALLHNSQLLTGSSVHTVDLASCLATSYQMGSSFPFEEIRESHTVEVVRVPEAHDSEAIYTYKNGDKDRPTLVIVHGGPHSTDTNGFLCAQMLYLLEGWNLLSVNYGGSLGFGHHRIQELMGHVGTNDVSDCIACIEAMRSRCGNENLVVYGGSHGGFLAGHLTGRYPDLFKAAIIRNPVINIASSHFETDIPDWNLAVCDENEHAIDVAKMYSMSPIVHANSVKAATLLGIGLEDKRVCPMQGRSWYLALKASPSQPIVRMIEYPENNHALDGVHAAADFAIRGVIFAQGAL